MRGEPGRELILDDYHYPKMKHLTFDHLPALRFLVSKRGCLASGEEAHHVWKVLHDQVKYLEGINK